MLQSLCNVKPHDAWLCTVRRQSGSDGPGASPDRRRITPRSPLEPPSAPVTPELGQALASILRPDRRRDNRHVSWCGCGRQKSTFILSPAERDYLERMYSQASRCESGAISLSRYVDAGPSAAHKRLIFAPRCCSRGCDSCDVHRRDRQRARCEGPWRLFLTIGVPSSAWTAREAWRLAPKWISALCARIRDNLRRSTTRDVRVCAPFRATWDRDRALMSDGRRPPGLIRYAWVIEPHKSGFPHIHMVLTCDFIDQAWLKRVWGEITASTIRWCKLRLVNNTDGICRYLSKYITKTSLRREVLACLYGGRMFACTLQRIYPPGSGYRTDRPGQAQALRGALAQGVIWSHIDPQRAVLFSSGSYALFQREASWSEVATGLPSYSGPESKEWSDNAPDDSVDPRCVSILFEWLKLDPSSGWPVGLPPSPKRPRRLGPAARSGELPHAEERVKLRSIPPGFVSLCLTIGTPLASD